MQGICGSSTAAGMLEGRRKRIERRGLVLSARCRSDGLGVDGHIGGRLARRVSDSWPDGVNDQGEAYRNAGFVMRE